LSSRLLTIPEETEDEDSSSVGKSSSQVYEQELKDLQQIEQNFFAFVLPWLKLIPEGASVPLEEV